ncbi:hypothetical protein MLD38_027363 [Melastoma candidum]|uniref:Uncharacterized protein n=1 Tax=Melastoma candidum TaxID=119954 RepID=A0ACB9P2G8_9MYRT|nr:hypothetical protein MLD38_027363 [Melastoma candidum]
MDDVKDKMKGFMKKVNNPFSSSSSGKFKGQGRVLGSSSSGPTNPNHSRPPLQSSSSAAAAAAAASRLPNVKSAQPQTPAIPDEKKPAFGGNQERNREPGTGFDPFDSLVTSSKRSQNGYTLNVVECPICNRSFKSEDEVSKHVDSCVGVGNGSVEVAHQPDSFAEGNCDLEACVGAFLSGKPSESSLDVVLKLFRNIVRDPENPKFRKIRMSNSKIREAVGDVAGGIELLENVGFELKEEDGEMWAVMEVPGKDRLDLISDAIMLLEPKKLEKPIMAANAAPADSSVEGKPKSIDRQIKVFFSVPESIAARIELPDSFYSLSIDEVKREADMRRKKIADSQLLIPKSYREKQMKAGRKRYNRTMIRIQFPDGVVLQGVFAPWEPTTAIYEFVAMALKEPSLEFELMHPVVVKRRVIPHWSSPGEKAVTLDDEDLVPSALIKFRPIETDTVVFTGLKNELLEIIEPLQ